MLEQRQWLSNPTHCCPFSHHMPEEQGSGQKKYSSFLKVCQLLSYKLNEKCERHLDMQNFTMLMCVFWKQTHKKTCMRIISLS